MAFEDAADEEPGWGLRRFLEERREALFTLPDAMAGEGPETDLFESWDEDDFFLAFLNGRVAVVVACPDAEALREPAQRLLKALSDRHLPVRAHLPPERAMARASSAGGPGSTWSSSPARVRMAR